MSHLGKPLGEVLLNDASYHYWGDISASVLNLPLSSQGREKIWCFFSTLIVMISHPLHLSCDEMTSATLEAFRLEPTGIDFFFFLFLSSFLEDSANSQSEGSDNSLAKNLLRWFFCPHWENLGQPDHSAPLGRLELVGAGLGSLLCVRCRHA